MFGKTTAVTRLPSAMEHLDRILERAGERAVEVFLDYDGTLTPIVRHPDQAVLSDAMREAVRALSGVCIVSVISGRDLADVRSRVGIQDLFYAGSHGFDVAGPKGTRTHSQQGAAYLPLLERAEEELRRRLRNLEGAHLERKKFSIAVHYRDVENDRLQQVKDVVEEVLSRHGGLRKSDGKKVFDLQPDIDWNKGKAVRWIMENLPAAPSDAFPIYIGDDVTDEDAFREIREQGAGIVVASKEKPTEARYRLADPDEVRRFLESLRRGLMEDRELKP